MNDTDDLKFERIDYTVKETGAAIRRALKAAFPGVKFSLRGSRGTGYGWFSLSWTDGPTTWAVDEITNGFRSSYFDGMDDSTRHIPATMAVEDDGVIREHRWSCNGVNSERNYTDEARAWSRAYVDAHGGAEVWNRGIALNDGESMAWRVLQGVDLTGIDWTAVADPAVSGGGSRIKACHVLDEGPRRGVVAEPKHRAETAGRAA
ncbi:MULTISPECIES: LPD29 domain-containing protein [unclassified Aeromicrobium]|uniref:LPD29 domain-containing protein n=1 Tax=unclassified Aeromicrobium TaxID=2633570 RepID=UPI00288AFA0D|nr:MULTISPECIES: LPD29 domain-containing protein [unclassified Aeromicrobium]